MFLSGFFVVDKQILTENDIPVWVEENCTLFEEIWFLSFKTASQMTANMMNLVEQKINNVVDYDGVLCRDGDNKLVFLFDANDGGAFDNEGENGGL